MQKGSSWKIVLAASFAVAGTIVAWRALDRATERGAFPERAVVDEESPTHEEPFVYELPEEEYDFQVRPTEKNLDEVLESVESKTLDAFAELPGQHRLGGYQEALFAEAAQRQVRIMLTGSYDLWLERALEFGPHPAAGDDGTLDPGFRDRWERHSQKLKYAPLSLEHYRIRPLRVRGEPVEYPHPRLFFKPMPSVSGKYPRFNSDELSRMDVYQIYFPLHYRSADSRSPDVPIHIGIAFAWDDERSRWAPYDMVCHSNGVGRIKMMSPAF